MEVIRSYIEKCMEIAKTIEGQRDKLATAAQWFADSIYSGNVVHVFGTGHNRIMVEELWPRYGSFPGFNPIVELSLTYHNNVTGANGQRQAMFLENVAGFAKKILRNFGINEKDTAFIISSSGCNVVPIEMAEIFQQKKVKVVALVTKRHLEASASKREDGKKLVDFADLVIDNGAPIGDSMISIPGLDTPVSPGSTVGGIMVVNSIKAEVARLLTEKGQPPFVLTAASVIGKERSEDIFEKAYDKHARIMAEVFKRVANL